MCDKGDHVYLSQILDQRNMIIDFCLFVCCFAFLVDLNPRKRGRPSKTSVCLTERYPLYECSDINEEDIKLALTALTKEISNSKPRKDVFFPLMKSTFTVRRHYILHDAKSVEDILEEYPALRFVTVVSVAKYI